jgi:hypothetical protein
VSSQFGQAISVRRPCLEGDLRNDSSSDEYVHSVLMPIHLRAYKQNRQGTAVSARDGRVRLCYHSSSAAAVPYAVSFLASLANGNILVPVDQASLLVKRKTYSSNKQDLEDDTIIRRITPPCLSLFFSVPMGCMAQICTNLPDKPSQLHSSLRLGHRVTLLELYAASI